RREGRVVARRVGVLVEHAAAHARAVPVVDLLAVRVDHVQVEVVVVPPDEGDGGIPGADALAVHAPGARTTAGRPLALLARIDDAVPARDVARTRVRGGGVLRDELAARVLLDGA